VFNKSNYQSKPRLQSLIHVTTLLKTITLDSVHHSGNRFHFYLQVKKKAKGNLFCWTPPQSSSQIIFFYYWWGGTKSLGTAATSGLLYKPQMIDEDHFWSNWWNEDWQGKPTYSEKTCCSATLSTTNPTRPNLSVAAGTIATLWFHYSGFQAAFTEQLPSKWSYSSQYVYSAVKRNFHISIRINCNQFTDGLLYSLCTTDSFIPVCLLELTKIVIRSPECYFNIRLLDNIIIK
jgi:hypothetical protein